MYCRGNIFQEFYGHEGLQRGNASPSWKRGDFKEEMMLWVKHLSNVTLTHGERN